MCLLCDDVGTRGRVHVTTHWLCELILCRSQKRPVTALIAELYIIFITLKWFYSLNVCLTSSRKGNYV